MAATKQNVYLETTQGACQDIFKLPKRILPEETKERVDVALGLVCEEMGLLWIGGWEELDHFTENLGPCGENVHIRNVRLAIVVTVARHMQTARIGWRWRVCKVSSVAISYAEKTMYIDIER
ncbi:hypothetical protein CRV24_010488 [Beauveria bassiana]|nr:hypothetical protein CRV24_010488 [Beauveria bassiana]KAH8715521.1 hypothetical protein HC256_004336 [Beauveria bassiana]